MKNYITRIINVDYNTNYCYNTLGQRFSIASNFEKAELELPFLAIIKDRQVRMIEDDVISNVIIIPTVMEIIVNNTTAVVL